jgi:hypothetical protein
MAVNEVGEYVEAKLYAAKKLASKNCTNLTT